MNVPALTPGERAIKAHSAAVPGGTASMGNTDGALTGGQPEGPGRPRARRGVASLARAARPGLRDAPCAWPLDAAARVR